MTMVPEIIKNTKRELNNTYLINDNPQYRTDQVFEIANQKYKIGKIKWRDLGLGTTKSKVTTRLDSLDPKEPPLYITISMERDPVTQECTASYSLRYNACYSIVHIKHLISLNKQTSHIEKTDAHVQEAVGDHQNEHSRLLSNSNVKYREDQEKCEVETKDHTVKKVGDSTVGKFKEELNSGCPQTLIRYDRISTVILPKGQRDRARLANYTRGVKMCKEDKLTLVKLNECFVQYSLYQDYGDLKLDKKYQTNYQMVKKTNLERE